jgi:hydrogenase small subunit
VANDQSIGEALRARGISRRGFLKFCAATASMMALPPSMVPGIARALEQARRPSVIWLSFQECTGCTESLTRSHSPTVEGLIFDTISLDYHHTLQAASGSAAEAARVTAMKENWGKYLLVVDGSVPVGNPGFSTIAGVSNMDMLLETAAGAAAIISVGSCAAFGGIPYAKPNPTGALPVSAFLSEYGKRIPNTFGADESGQTDPVDVTGKTVINVSGCPPIPVVITGVLAHFLTFDKLPELDDLGRPLAFYGKSIHDRCYRRPFYDKGLFANSFDDEGAKKGWCLYKLGCKGPTTYNACATTKWNGGTSFPIQSGHPCLGCSQPDFWDGGGFYNSLSTPTEKIARAAVFAAGAAAAVGVALGAANRAKQAHAAKQHEKVTINDLDKGT